MQSESIKTEKTSCRSERGFTLLEIIIAMFILTVALLSLVSVTVMVIKGNSLSKQMTTATTLARDKLEATKNQSYTNIAAGTESFDPSGLAAGTFYTRTLVVNNNTPANNMKTVTVTVSWTWGILPRSVTLRTIMGS